jgi:hypothetical protein
MVGHPRHGRTPDLTMWDGRGENGTTATVSYKATPAEPRILELENLQ